jgi:copper homeostasis protein (lipoprotein)
MFMQKRILAIFITLFLLNSCNQSTEIKETGITSNEEALVTPKDKDSIALTDKTVKAVSTPDNSFNSLNWNGTYTGTLPCEDCDGKQTTITLNKDLSYTVEQKHITKSAKLFPQQGTFEWNKEGNKITLKGIENAPAKYLVGESGLIPLDANGNRVNDNIILNKQGANTTLPITETRWILKEMMGKQVEINADKSKPFFIQLRASDNRMAAFAGCNSIAGPYEITENNRLKFGKLMSTMMACENMETEFALSKVLEETNSYVTSDKRLQLLSGSAKPLATFVAE